MRPSLLYLRNYIQYSCDSKPKKNDSKSKVSKQNNVFGACKKSQFQSFDSTHRQKYIFTSKAQHTVKNSLSNKKQFYFKMNRLNLSRQSKITTMYKTTSQSKYQSQNSTKRNSKQNVSKIMRYNSRNSTETNLESFLKQKNRCIQALQQVQNNNNQQLSIDKYKRKEKDSQSTQNKEPNIKQNDTDQMIDQIVNIQSNQKQVKFNVFLPRNKQNYLQQQNQAKCSVQVSLHQSQNDLNSQHQFDQNQKNQNQKKHFNIGCRSVKKIGYNTLSDYLTEMERFNQIKQVQIKQACYYPLQCMKDQQAERDIFKQIDQQEKNQFKNKIKYYQNKLIIKQNFKPEKIFSKKIEQKINKSMTKSKFKSGNTMNEKNDNPFQQKKFLLEYDSILMVNCNSKRFFNYKIQNSADYTSFFKYAAPSLDLPISTKNTTPLSKRNKNQLTANKEVNLYFCCLINQVLHVKEGFFWISKPVPYYSRNNIISAIDSFLESIHGIDLIDSQKIWIADSSGCNSFITKSSIVKAMKPPALVKSSLKNPKSRISKRGSLYGSLGQLDLAESTTQSLFGLLAKTVEFNQSMSFKKERLNISTKGSFKMIYDER